MSMAGYASTALAEIMEIALRVKEFCKRLSIAESTFYKYKRLGKIHTIRVGNLVLVPMAEVNRIASEGIN